MWTEKQPTETGFYWWRSDTDTPRVIEILNLMGNQEQFGLYVRGVSRNMYSLSDWDGGEWWTERIQEPQPDDKEKK